MRLFEAAGAPLIIKRLTGRYGAYSVFLVNGEQVRSSCLDGQEFGESAINALIPIVPKDEIWIEDCVSKDEIFPITHSNLFLLNELSRGVDFDKAYDRSQQYERNMRSILSGDDYGERFDPLYVYVDKYGELSGPDCAIDVYVVDGERVRDSAKTDFTEGGHDVVYNWIPTGEIWLEDLSEQDELPYILLHEFTERCLMQEGLTYDKAHDICSKVEFSQRSSGLTKERALALTVSEVLELASQFR